MLIIYDDYNINISLIKDPVLANSYISFDINKDCSCYSGILFASKIKSEYRIYTLADFTTFYNVVKQCFNKENNYDVKIVEDNNKIILNFREPYLNIKYLGTIKKNMFSFTCEKVI